MSHSLTESASRTGAQALPTSVAPSRISDLLIYGRFYARTLSRLGVAGGHESLCGAAALLLRSSGLQTLEEPAGVEDEVEPHQDDLASAVSEVPIRGPGSISPSWPRRGRQKDPHSPRWDRSSR